MQTASLLFSPPPGVTKGLEYFLHCISFSKLFAEGLILPGVGERRAQVLGPHLLRTRFKGRVNGLPAWAH